MADNKILKRDLVLEALAAGLSVIGILMVFDTCALDRSTGSHMIFQRAYKQILFAALSYLGYRCLIRLVCRKENLKFVKRWTVPALIVSLVILGLVALTGDEVNGAARWLSVGGLTLQPSELIKPVFCLGLAWYTSEYKKASRSFGNIVFILLLFMAGAVGASNMSTGILYVGVLFLGLFAGGYEREKVCYLFIGFVVCALLAVHLGAGFRQMRIAAWLDPVAYASQEGDQVLKSLATIASAGFLGCGFGNGHAKYIIPEPSNDYIFTTIAEETGCLGCIGLIVLYFGLFLKACSIFIGCRSRYCRVMCLCAAFFIIMQAFVNISVTLNMIPSTGVCLPLVSYGGSSVISCYLLFCLMQFASMHRNHSFKAFRLYARRKPVYQKLRPAAGGRSHGAHSFGGGFASDRGNEG